jgi:hypothetical protein
MVMLLVVFASSFGILNAAVIGGRISDILGAMQVPPEHQSSVTTDAAKFRFMVSRLGTGADGVPLETMQQYMTAIEKVAETTYPAFLRSSEPSNNQRELCAFLDIINWETDFITFEEGACAGNAGSNPKCDYIDRTVPFVEGKQYFGRGPKQLSWNYNYLEYSRSLFGDDRLLSQPELVLKDFDVMWGSALWFWMSEGKEGATNYGGFCPPQAVWSCQETCTAWHANPNGTNVGTCDCAAARQQGHYIAPGKLSPHKAIVSDAGILGVVNIVNGGYDCCPTTQYGPKSNARGHTSDRVVGYLTCTELFGLVDSSKDLNFYAGDTCPVVSPNSVETCPDCSCMECAKTGSTWYRPWKCSASKCKDTTTTAISSTSTLPTSSLTTTSSPIIDTTGTSTSTTSFLAGRAIQSGDTIFLKSEARGTYLDVEDSVAQIRWDEQGSWQELVIEKNGGPTIQSGDSIFLRARNGKYLHVDDRAVQALWDDMGTWQTLVVEKAGGGPILPDDIVCLKAHTGKYIDAESGSVRARLQGCGALQHFLIQRGDRAAVHSDDTVFLKGHTGNHVEVQGDSVRARFQDKGAWQALRLQTHKARRVFSGDTVFLVAHTRKHLHVQGDAVQAGWKDLGVWQSFVVEKFGGGAVYSGDTIFLRAHTGKHIDIEGDVVRARWQDNGAWQSLVIETLGNLV